MYYFELHRGEKKKKGILIRISDFLIILDERSAGSTRLFLMVDYKISANSQHYAAVFFTQRILFG